jgi:chromate reductase
VMNEKFHALAVRGRLRSGSFNKMAPKAAKEIQPKGMEIDIFDLSPIPLYYEFLRAQDFRPSVATFRSIIREAGALLISTPEYIHSNSGVVKNAIDWASGPPNHPFNRKPVGITGMITGLWGTNRAQLDLRHICVYLNMFPLNRPEVLIARVREKFNDEGNLVDEAP